jgi:hypothetical protein
VGAVYGEEDALIAAFKEGMEKKTAATIDKNDIW